MAIDTQLIKGHNKITNYTALEAYTHAMEFQYFEQPMDNVVLRAESFLPPAAIQIPFQKPPLPCLEFVYSLSGDTVLSLRNGAGEWHDVSVCGGVQSLVYNTGLHAMATVSSSVPVRTMHLYITPQKLAYLLGSGSAQVVQTIIDQAGVGSNSHPKMTTSNPQITSILHQIFTRDSASPADSLFLKGKILELLAREVALLCRSPQKSTLLQTDDVRKLQTARTIMMKCMAAPPSLAGLARQVGLNEKKIKQGFKALYGTTVYGFLRDYRMAQAKLMFGRDYASVTDVACAVGYSNVSHFCVIFRQYHGVRPGEYLRALRKEQLTRQLCL